MWDYTLHSFKCPYCGHEYKTTVGGGCTYLYKGNEHSAVEHPCPYCGEMYLYGRADLGDEEFIKMPEDKTELKLLSCWMS
jgi:uncharacterized Zn-finger protein